MIKLQAVSAHDRKLSSLNFFTSLGDHFGAGIAGKGFSLALANRLELRLGIDVSDDFDWRIHIDSAYEASILQQLANKPPVPEHPSFVRGSLASLRWSCPKEWARSRHRQATDSSKPGLFISHIFFECERLTSSEIDWLNESDLVTSGSDWAAQVMIDNGLRRVATVHQGVELDIFRRPDTPLPRPVEWEGKFLIFTGGKYEYRKGVDLAIAAFAKFRQRHRDAFLLINAFNPWPSTQSGLLYSTHFRFRPIDNYPEDLERVLIDNDIPSDSFQVLQPTSRRNLASVMAMSDCGMFPIRCEGGTNHFLMEYMSCGRPLVATYTTGLTDILRPDENCVAIRPFTPVPVNFVKPDWQRGTWHEPGVDEIVEALERLYDSRDDGERLAERGLNDIQEFSWTRCADKLIKVIEDAIADTSIIAATTPDRHASGVTETMKLSTSQGKVKTSLARHLLIIEDATVDHAAPLPGNLMTESVSRILDWSVAYLAVDTSMTGHGLFLNSMNMQASMRTIRGVLAEIGKQIKAFPRQESSLIVLVRGDMSRAQRWIKILGRTEWRKRLFLVLNPQVDCVPLAPEYGEIFRQVDAVLTDSKFAGRAVKAMLAEDNFVFTGPVVELFRDVPIAPWRVRDEELKTDLATFTRDRIRRDWFRVGSDTILIGCHFDEHEYQLGMILHLFHTLIGQPSDPSKANGEAECKWRLHVMGRGRTREHESIMIDYRRRLGLESLVSIEWMQANTPSRGQSGGRSLDGDAKKPDLSIQLQCLDIFLDLGGSASMNRVFEQACIHGLSIVAVDYGEVAECFASRIPLVPVANWRLESSGYFEPLPDIRRAMELIKEYASSITLRAQVGKAANAAMAQWRSRYDDRRWLELVENCP